MNFFAKVLDFLFILWYSVFILQTPEGNFDGRKRENGVGAVHSASENRKAARVCEFVKKFSKIKRRKQK